jgi:hypothetical protein
VEQEYYTVLLLLNLATGEKKRRLLMELHELAQTIEQADEILSDSLEDYRSKTVLLETLDPELEHDGETDLLETLNPESEYDGA